MWEGWQREWVTVGNRVVDRLQGLMGVGLEGVWEGWMGGQHKSRVIEGAIRNVGGSGTGRDWVGPWLWVAGMSTEVIDEVKGDNGVGLRRQGQGSVEWQANGRLGLRFSRS